MKRNQIFPSRWFKAVDLDPEGEELTIRKVTLEEIGEEQEEKPIVALEESEKKLILNITNWNQIAELTGEDDSENWPGHKIKLVRVKVEYGGKTFDAIRIEPVEAPKKPLTKLVKRTLKPATAPVGRRVDDDGEEIPF